MKITSRTTTDDLNLSRLREILEAASHGAIAEDGEILPGENLAELVAQVDIICAAFLDTLDVCERKIDLLMQDVEIMSGRLRTLDDTLQEVMGVFEDGVDYDDDLDHATIDMMEALIASGATEPTFDGELSFPVAVTISKEDFKPIVRQAIESWLRLKVR